MNALQEQQKKQQSEMPISEIEEKQRTDVMIDTFLQETRQEAGE